jgi:hypothetical protein
MDDPDQARRLMEERIAKLEKEKEQAGKNEEAAKRLAEEERAKAAEERARAEEERRIRLEVQAEVHELRAKLGLQGRP